MSTNGKHGLHSERISADQSPPHEHHGGADPLSDLLTRLAALTDYVAHYATAKIDTARARVRTVVLVALGGMLGLVAIVVMLVSFWVYLLAGLAGGLSVALGNRPWLGDLLAGSVGLLLLLGGAALLIRRALNRQRRARIQKYEERKAKERIRYGQDTDARSRAAA